MFSPLLKLKSKYLIPDSLSWCLNTRLFLFTDIKDENCEQKSPPLFKVKTFDPSNASNKKTKTQTKKSF